MITQEQKQAGRTRRTYAKRGERNQKMVTFRLDNELAGYLSSMPNKGRYINELIAADMKNRGES